MNHGGDDGGAVPAVAAVDILHHLLAPRMLEIDVDVGRLQPLLGNEALEQQVDLGRIDRGDIQHVADGRVRRRAPALAEDFLAARVKNDVVHGEKVMRVFQLSDQAQFLVQDLFGLGRDPHRESAVRAGPGQVFQMALRGLARRHRLVGILVFELVERKPDAAGKPQGFRDRLRHIAEQPRHFAGRLEMAFGIGFEPPADGVDGGLLADAGQDILQGTARRMMVQHLVGRQQRHAGLGCDAMQPRQTAAVVAAVKEARRQPDTVGAALPQPVQHLDRPGLLEAMRQRQDEQLAFGKFQEVGELQMAFALFGAVAALAAGEQLAEPAVSRAVARIDQDVRRPVHEDEPRSDQQFRLVFDVGIRELLVGPHHAGQRVVVGNADGGKPQLAPLVHVIPRIRSAAQEREIRRDPDLRIGRHWRNAGRNCHANNPCMNQFGCTILPSSCMISRS